MAISGVSMPSTVTDYRSDTSLSSSGSEADSSPESLLSSVLEAQGGSADMLSSLPELADAWTMMAS